MKKYLTLSLIFFIQLNLLPYPLHAQSNDLVEDPDVPEGLPSWNIIDIKFPNRLTTNTKTGKKIIPIEAQFEYQAESADDSIRFGENLIWHVNCFVSDTSGGNLKILFEQLKKFTHVTHPQTAPDAAYGNGAKLKSMVYIEFDKSLVKQLRRGKTMSCGFGFNKPVEYEYLNMKIMNQDIEEGNFMTYTLKLKGNRWIIKGVNI